MTLFFQPKSNVFKLILTCFLLILMFVGSKEISAQNSSPYGSHSHIFVPKEWVHFPKNLDLMRAGGLGWMRSDFYWTLIEKKQGNWDYSQYDKIVEEAGKRNIQILGILGYSVPWAQPAYNYPEKWTEYVTRTVSRYKGRVNYWEVWNEENIQSFWKKKPDPEEYTRFLKITAEAARKANPDAKILLGGTAGIPYKYIEDCLKAGAGQWFDIMNIHPYRNVMNTNFSIHQFYDDIAKIRSLLTQYKVGGHPIWITEMGWSDHQLPDTGKLRGFFNAAWKILSPDKPVKEVAILHDPVKLNSCKKSNFQIFANYLPQGVRLVPVKIDELKQLDPAKVPYVIMPPRENFPVACFDFFYDYIKKGGTLFFTCGFPCYYNVHVPGMKESPIGENSAMASRKNFRMDVHAWWFDNKVPKKADRVFSDPTFSQFFNSSTNKGKADLFLGSKYLKEGDRLIPVLLGQTGDFTEPVAGIYRFNSDLKGNIAVYTLYDSSSWAYATSEEIETYLPQTYLIAFSAGIERFFTYQFQARETKPEETEDHFGLVHNDLSPKSGYIALSALTKARPAGSIPLTEKKNENGLMMFSWKRPDGRVGWAIWNLDGHVAGTLKLTGKISESFDFSGKPVSLNSEKIEITEKTLYLIGPEEINITIDN